MNLPPSSQGSRPPEGESAAWERPGAATVTTARVEAALRNALQPTAVEVQDDSHLHAGHAGAKEGRHFTVRVTSESFTGLSRVARHRLVYDALRSLVAEGIHALAIDARTPAEPRR